MNHKSTSVQPDLFEQNRPRILLAPIHKERLAALVKALLIEIAAALASGRNGRDRSDDLRAYPGEAVTLPRW